MFWDSIWPLVWHNVQKCCIEPCQCMHFFAGPPSTGVMWHGVPWRCSASGARDGVPHHGAAGGDTGDPGHTPCGRGDGAVVWEQEELVSGMRICSYAIEPVSPRNHCWPVWSGHLSIATIWSHRGYYVLICHTIIHLDLSFSMQPLSPVGVWNLWSCEVSLLLRPRTFSWPRPQTGTGSRQEGVCNSWQWRAHQICVHSATTSVSSKVKLVYDITLCTSLGASCIVPECPWQSSSLVEVLSRETDGRAL